MLGREADRPFRRDMDRFGREILDHRCDGPAGPDRDPKLRQEAVGRGLEAVRADHLDLIVLLLQRFDEAVQQPLNPMPHGQPLVGGDQDAQRMSDPSAVATAWTIANDGAKPRRRRGADGVQARERDAVASLSPRPWQRGIEREKLLRPTDAAQGIAADRDEIGPFRFRRRRSEGGR